MEDITNNEDPLNPRSRDSYQPRHHHHHLQQQEQPSQQPSQPKVKFYQNINFVVFLLCMLNICQCMVVTGQLMLSIPLLEKIFGFKSYQMSFPNICYNVAFGICSILIGYRTVNRKILAIGIGGIIVAIGCFLFITPHYISSYKVGPASFHNDTTAYGMQQYHTCKLEIKNPTTSPPPDNNNNSHGEDLFDWDRNRSSICLAIFCLAFAIMGIGSSPLHIFIITYLNQGTSNGKDGIYLAIFYISGAIGPALGFILGKPFLSVHVNWPVKPENLEITSDSENWIGAWWLGFFTGGIAITVFSICIVITGLKIKSPKPKLSVIKSQSSKHQPTTTATTTATIIDQPIVITTANRAHNFIIKTSYLCSDHSMMLIFLGLSFDMLPLTAFTSFITKIITVQFRVNVNNASLITGAVVIPAACTGFAMGSIYNKLVKTSYHKILGLCIISYLTMIFAVGMFVNCPSRDVSGVVINSNKIVTSILTKECNTLCNCNYYRYEPVCHNSTTYFNPCVLGCTDSDANQTPVHFQHCGCIHDFDSNKVTHPVSDGGCVDYSCKNIYIYLSSAAITLILVLSLGIPFILYTLSVTKESMKDYSIGFLQTMVRFFVICGPLLYGYLIDQSCILWLPGKFKETKGNCAEYDNKKMNNLVSTAILSTKLFASFCYTLAFVFYLKRGSR